jgi:hypothetical protein
MDWRDLREKNVTVVGGAVSGGLDSCTTTHWLSGKGFSAKDMGIKQLATLAQGGNQLAF